MGARQVQVVLVAHRHAGQRAHLGQAPLGDGPVDAGSGIQGQRLSGLQEGVHYPVGGLDALEGTAGHFSSGELLGGEPRLELADGHASERRCH